MKYSAYTLYNYSKIPQLEKLSDEEKFDIEVVGNVLPFKTNNYVVDELIDWDNYKNDPIYILNFPQRGMLSNKHYNLMADTIRGGATKAEIRRIANEIRKDLNPHPAGQVEHNVPELHGEKLVGIQHKYDETLLFFPSQGQTCHAYCTFCFRWPQFVGMDDLKFAMKQGDLLVQYLKEHSEITDVLFTGGDPMVMKASVFNKYIDSLLEADIPNLKTIRIGTKALGFWPYRFLTDPDAGELLETFKKIVKAGKHLAIMAHFNHYAELKTEAVTEAVKLIRNTGANIRTQSPILNHINASSEIWKNMWIKQVEMGMVPYYMFIARDTGARDYFGVPIVKAWEIFRNAYANVSGICRTARGPSMSADPGKVLISGVSEINGQKVIMLTFLQGRNSEWVRKPFFAKYNEEALWLDELEPAFGQEEFFFNTKKIIHSRSRKKFRFEGQNIFQN
ncbi:MAG: lysine 2,3-aminomutase [Bacteroidota bacterium]|nr:lysine 2,3-aminomutase [Bacteroidota bacterium]